MKLLSRDEFRSLVLARCAGRCCVPGCLTPAADAHHIVERRLWDDGGYYLENGAPVCAEHHLACERTWISPDDLRGFLGYKTVLPAHLPPDDVYDKWGNVVNPDGSRSPGELFWDESVQRVLRSADVLPLFQTHRKYPKTPHLPNSPGRRDDDTTIDERSLKALLSGDVVVTEKMDGENTTFYRDGVHARSLDSMGHSSQAYVKRLHSEVAHDIPPGWRVVGENMYATHSIAYDDLESYFLVFAIFDERDNLLPWRQVEYWAALLDLQVVPVVAEGTFDSADSVHAEWVDYASRRQRESEGFVVRAADATASGEFRRRVAKWVRPGHVQTVQHGWKYRNDYAVNKLGGAG